MPEFILDTSGSVIRHDGAPLHFYDDLDAFTQGYVKALFFTEEESLGENASELRSADIDAGRADFTLGFSDLAPEALARIIDDCAKFQAAHGRVIEAAREVPGYGPGEERGPCDDEHAGRDFWYTRNGHGCGFWDGDWPEPYATHLTTAAGAFGEVDVYLGDDGKVHLS